LLERTLVVCGGEFGRTPKLNAFQGRDHWPNGFSLLLAGGGIRAGHVLGETDPDGKLDPKNPVGVPDIHATLLAALGIDYKLVRQTPIGRTVKLSEGTPIAELLASP
jgi:uncharacterized protein (DUF1501 family)